MVLQVQPPSSGLKDVGAVFIRCPWSARQDVVCAPIGARPLSDAGYIFTCGQGGSSRVCAHAPRRRDCRSTSVPCVGQNHGLEYQPTLKAMQDDSPSSHQGLLLGWGESLHPACYGGASSVPGQAPAVPEGQDRLAGRGERFAGGHGLRADGDKACCPGDWPSHGVHGSPAEASMAYLSRP